MTEHRMRIARPSLEVARRLGLNRNHQARVWCDCMDAPVNEPGTFAGMDPSVVNERTVEQAANDPRRLGSFDAIGVIDIRDPDSLKKLWSDHLHQEAPSI